MRVHRNRAGRRFEHHTIANRQSDPQNAARSPQNGLGAPEAQRSSETPPFQNGDRNENRPGPNFKVSTMRSYQNRLERHFGRHTMVNRQPDPQNAAQSLQNGRGAPEAEHSSSTPPFQREPTRPELQTFNNANPPEPFGTQFLTPHSGQSTTRPAKVRNTRHLPPDAA